MRFRRPRITLQVVVDLATQLGRVVDGGTGEQGEQVRFPEAGVVAGGEHLLPEHELQFSDDLTGGGLSAAGRDQVLAGLVSASAGWEASCES